MVKPVFSISSVLDCVFVIDEFDDPWILFKLKKVVNFIRLP